MADQLSEGEAALYDRQLRLWGVEAQQKLRSTRVMVGGMSALGAEVCKNIVLSGVCSVTMVDHRKLTEKDIPGQFLAPFDSLGKNRAAASVQKLSSLNPNVKVAAEERPVADLENSFFDSFDIVCLFDYPFAELSRVDAYCRSKKIVFIAGDTIGSFGWMFSDLGSSFYCTSEVVNIKDGQKVKTVNSHDLNFKSFDEAFSNSESMKNNLQKSEIVFMALLKDRFCADENRGSFRDASFPALAETVRQVSKDFDVPLEKLLTDLLCDAIMSKSAEVSAVVGGIIGREVIKVASRNSLPLNNFFCFNQLESTARVISV